MNPNTKHQRDYRLRYYEVDGRGRLCPVALLALIEETAASHCDASGLDVLALRERGIGWVLLRGGFEMRRYPRYRETMRIETWVSEARRVFATREYRILGGEGEVLGAARSLWLQYDLEAGRPASILPAYIEAWKPDGVPAADLAIDDLGNLGAPEPGQGTASFSVRRSDIDTNGHVNNVVYLGWALEALPFDANGELVLRRLRGRFAKEVLAGAEVLPTAAELEGGGGQRRVALGVYARDPGALAGEARLAAAAESSWGAEESR